MIASYVAELRLQLRGYPKYYVAGMTGLWHKWHKYGYYTEEAVGRVEINIKMH